MKNYIWWYWKWKTKFSQLQKSYFLDVDTDNTIVIYKIYSSETNYKYFIGYLYDDYKFKSLNINTSKKKSNVKDYDGETNWMYFLIKDDNLLNKYNTIWDKFSADLNKTLIKSLYTKKIGGPKQNFRAMKLKIFTIKK